MVNGQGWLYLDEHLDAASQILSHHIRVECLDLPLHKPLGVAICCQPGLWHLLLPRSLRGAGAGAQARAAPSSWWSCHQVPPAPLFPNHWQDLDVTTAHIGVCNHSKKTSEFGESTANTHDASSPMAADELAFAAPHVPSCS